VLSVVRRQKPGSKYQQKIGEIMQAGLVFVGY